MQHLKSVDEGSAAKEATLKMAIADSIFDDIIGDTPVAFMEAHGEEVPKSAQLSSSSSGDAKEGSDSSNIAEPFNHNVQKQSDISSDLDAAMDMV